MKAYEVAARFMGIREVAGPGSNPIVLAMLQLDNRWPKDDSVPWCSAFTNFICFICGLPRTRSLSARSWLKVGTPVAIPDAVVGNDIIVVKRGGGNQPGPEVLDAQGHVGFFGGLTQDKRLVRVLGGNQGDSVSIAPFPVEQILGIRRLA